MVDMTSLESDIGEWRSFVERGPAMDSRDLDELEDHLRSQIADLAAAGLTDDEAFLVAVRRIGAIDEVTREFAREHSGRLWRQLVTSDGGDRSTVGGSWRDMLVFAVAAAVVLEIVLLASGYPAEEPAWLLRNAGLLVLPFLAGYFIRRRRISAQQTLVTAVPFLSAAVVINLYPFAEGSSTELLVAAHLPVVLWFVCAYPYMSCEWRSPDRRMDFVRFTGEWFIYYVLIALGGFVLVALSIFILEPTGILTGETFVEYVGPAGAAAAVIVCAWLVESKQRVVENMAPVLTMIFTPLFALMLTVAVIVYAATGLGGAFDRELLGVFDAMLVVVLGLVLYAISARDPSAPPGWMDRIQLVTVVAALVLDVMVLGTMVARVGELGFTPNRTAALGLNVILLVNLVGTAWLSSRLVTGRGTFHTLERWQTSYLPVFAVWAAVVVVVLPPLSGFE
jgi:hypothetical protein